MSISEKEDDTTKTFEQEFIEACLNRGLGRTTINELMGICRKHNKGNFPNDMRSTVPNIRTVSIRNICQGSYHHFGLISGLNKIMSSVSVSENSVIKLQFNVDGLPIHKSTQKGFWPILSRVMHNNLWSRVFIVGLFWGKGKPRSVNDFLLEFVEELSGLLESGLQVNGVTVKVLCHSFVCDAPARSFVKCIKGHNSEKCCERCTVQGLAAPGQRSDKEFIGVRYFDTNCSLRSNQSFRSQLDSDHHHDILCTPLSQLAIDLVLDFPLDYMHLVLLGVVKKCLLNWTGNVKTKSRKFHLHRIGGPALTMVNERLTICSVQMCDEFQRRPRSLTEINFFKATEFRNIVVYLFPLVFNGAFPCSNVYSHFCSLVVAVRILLCPNGTSVEMDYCRSLLVSLVESCSSLYGNSFMVYNVHSLIHLPDDYLRFGSLDNVSAFAFESFMQVLKRYVRRPGKELAQVVKRVHELENLSCPQKSGCFICSFERSTLCRPIR